MYCEKQHTPVDEAHMSDKFIEFFSSRLRDALVAGSMSQVDLLKLFAENKLDMTQQRLSHYMQGRNYPDPPAFRDLVKMLGVSADWVLGLTEESLPAETLNEMANSARGEAHINKIMRNMSKERQRQVIAFAEFLLTQEQKDRTQVVPAISPLPLSERQRNITAIRTILESVEREHGTTARRDMERTIREEFSNVDNTEK
jgi:transcriptional regulator with XRE-family HTH domain